jgi:RNA polymerase sigma-70 factor (ECF subfamily)
MLESVFKRTGPLVQPEGYVINDSEAALVTALKQGDEKAFMLLVERYHRALQRLALSYVGGNWTLAEEVVQETWIAVLQGIHKFEGRSSLKTWIYRILMNRARTRGSREARSVPFADLQPGWLGPDEPAVEPSAFYPAGDNEGGWWINYPANWESVPESRLLARETRAVIDAAIAALPPNQQVVITLRDVEGWPADEVSAYLAISDANQRVLLHRARAKVRQALAGYLSEGSADVEH